MRSVGWEHSAAAVEAAVLASEQENAARRDLSRAARELEAARYTAHRAEKQYDATDPENRLVASELECRWNQALQKVLEVEQRIQQQGQQQKIAATTREEFEKLASEFGAE